ncbi:MAG: enoyl-CoA hydratase/isomerase family protein [Planctomycetes bacterium]|nr:enoyl-CoA hydratase/isomerase family protein [Planctomycetota bacterium]
MNTGTLLREGRHVTLTMDDDGYTVVTIGHANDKVVTITHELMQEFEETLDELDRLREQVRGVIFTGSRPDMFAAGADIGSIRELETKEDATTDARRGQHVFRRVESLPFPTVAAIGGPCLGGAYELALACRAILASDHPKTRIGLPEVQIGIIPGFGGTQRLPRRAGLPNALAAILGGKRFHPAAARSLGLVDEVVPRGFLMDRARAWVLRMTAPSFRAKKLAWTTRLLTHTRLGRRIVANRARAQVIRETRGHYAAPLRAIESAVYGLGKSALHRDRAYAEEARILGELAVGPTCRQLTRLFFMQRDADKLMEPARGLPALERVGILGAGVMGAAIAETLARRGISVRLKDTNPEALGKALAAVQERLQRDVARKRLTEQRARAVLDRISPTLDEKGFRDAQIVIEAIVEKLEPKRAAFRAIAEQVQDDCLLVTNTSSLSVAEIGEGIDGPERFGGLHFFNPVEKMPLVEIIRGPATTSTTVARLARVVNALGKTPVVVKDVQGFLVNRMLAPYLNEAGHLYEEGIAIERIDAIARDFGMPMGPFELLDEVGIDVASHASRTLYDHYGDRLRPTTFLDVLLEKGLLGRKVGRGVYVYPSGRAKRINPDVPLPPSRDAGPTDEEILDRLVLPFVAEAFRCLEEGVAKRPDDIDLASVLGTGFAPFRGGVLSYGKALGRRAVHDKLQGLASKHGERFRPEPSLRMASPPHTSTSLA